jgi:hypothetical protein
VSLRTRIKALEGRCPRYRLRPEDCPYPFTTAVISADDPRPAEADLRPCPECGHPHILVVKTVVVDEPEEGGR